MNPTTRREAVMLVVPLALICLSIQGCTEPDLDRAIPQQVPLKARRLAETPSCRRLATVTFQVTLPNSPDGPSPYVNVEQPENDIRFLADPDAIVLAHTDLTIIIDYPVTGQWAVQVVAPDPAGFSRAALARAVSNVYHRLYAEEDRTSRMKVVPREQRHGLINRNKTDGTFGICCHDIGDLDLHTVEICQAEDGTFLAALGIDS